jgi:hypothetical protein
VAKDAGTDKAPVATVKDAGTDKKWSESSQNKFFLAIVLHHIAHSIGLRENHA